MMGKVLSTHLGDRKLNACKRTPPTESLEVQVVKVGENGKGIVKEQYATATTVNVQTSLDSTATKVYNASLQSTAQSTPMETAVSTTTVSHTTATSWKPSDIHGRANSDEQITHLVCAFVFIGLCICLGVAAMKSEIWNSSFNSLGSPTPFPTTAGADTFICPTVFDVKGMNMAESACAVVGCSGFIEWCGLNDSQAYQLIVSVRGDYDFHDEFITVIVNGTLTKGTATQQCGKFQEIFNLPVWSSEGSIRLSYVNTVEVDPICFTKTASELKAILFEL